MRWITGKELERFVQQQVKFYQPSAIGNVGLDVHLGSKLYIEKEIHSTQRLHVLEYATWRELYDTKVIPMHGHTLKAKHFLLAETLEYFQMPAHVSGTMTLRSWAAKSGLEQSSSLDLKPGWEGNLILELFNSLTHHELQLLPGSAIAQIKFFDIRGNEDDGK